MPCGSNAETKHACCAPSGSRGGAEVEASEQAQRECSEATLERMIALPGGSFLMGTDTDEGFPAGR